MASNADTRRGNTPFKGVDGVGSEVVTLTENPGRVSFCRRCCDGIAPRVRKAFTVNIKALAKISPGNHRTIG